MATEALYDWRTEVQARTGRIALLGYLVILVLVGGFGYWAASAPIGGAVVSHGIVAAAGQNIILGHLEGGIVKQIKVVEGQHVTAGQALIELDPTAALTQLNRQIQQMIALETKAARLRAERDGTTEVVMPAGFSEKVGGADFSRALDEQQKEFAAHLARYASEVDILNQRLAALVESRQGNAARIEAVKTQLGIVQQEVARKKDLLDQGLTERSDYTTLLRTEADLTGQLGQIESDDIGAQIQIAEARQQLERQTTTRVETAVSDLSDVSAQIADVEEQVIASRALLSRTTLRAPKDGIVVKLSYNSPGSIIGPGQPIVELLPTTNGLIVEAQVPTSQIDEVRVGQRARLRLVALNARKTPEVSATVFYVSADRLTDSDKKRDFYVVRMKMDADLPPGVSSDQIYPGMPIESYISTGDRTFFEYLVRPVLDSMSRAFREE